jgi:mannose-1-phosphate guanylyltransferase
MIHAVIMAGGSGTRFWPESRNQKPKQLLKLGGDLTMIQSTVARLEGLVTSDNIMIVTNQRLVDPINAQLPQLSADSLIGEPCKRDTAPCVGIAAALIAAKDPDAVMVVMPADHVIQQTESFQQAIQSAIALIDDHPRQFVTFGIKPTYPAESFGYVERDDARPLKLATAKAFAVQRFREKPNADTAREFLATGRFYWNSGIFVWRAQAILNALQEFEPEMFAHIARIRQAIGKPNFEQVFVEEFTAISGKSIDFAVMERYDDVAVIEASFDWDDVGNWPALARLRGTDKNGNTIVGRHLGIKTSGTIVHTDSSHLVVTLGLEDLIVVHTADATLVAHRKHEEQIRQVVQEIESLGWLDFL